MPIATPQPQVKQKPALFHLDMVLIYTDERRIQASKFITHPALQGMRLTAFRIADNQMVTDTSVVKITWIDRLLPIIFLQRTGLRAFEDKAIVLMSENAFVLEAAEKLAAKNFLVYWGNLPSKKAHVQITSQNDDPRSVTSFVHHLLKIYFG